MQKSSMRKSKTENQTLHSGVPPIEGQHKKI